ncbi:MAG: hypothetical protein R3C17_16245 [Planctomycetaceae bacterium]
MRTKQLTILQAAAVKRCIAATFKLAQNQDRFRDKVHQRIVLRPRKGQECLPSPRVKG